MAGPVRVGVSGGVSKEIVSALAPQGVLRAGINLSNFLLVTGRGPAGEPVGVAPDMARALADRLGVAVSYVPCPNPGAVADGAAADAWDIGLIGAEPARAETIDFSPAYVEIEATYLVPPGSKIARIEEVDRPGVRIAVVMRSAYDLWLARNLKAATLIHPEPREKTFEAFVENGYEALAGLRTGLEKDAARLPGSRLLDGRFTAVQQAVGVRKGNAAGAAFIRAFVEEAKASGLVAELIARHHVHGLLVAPAEG